ncbi:zinc finger protein 2 homolog [Teleopsis dalmanni]|uniref:zinc finger protein 2 homolog n=1 Tax=Teleopsis dalmanni TaxID=139649 RepID=UPI0018CF4153|nr:zinc finger protein 2 homolog [Teleopsis dalmanni]
MSENNEGLIEYVVYEFVKDDTVEEIVGEEYILEECEEKSVIVQNDMELLPVSEIIEMDSDEIFEIKTENVEVEDFKEESIGSLSEVIDESPPTPPKRKVLLNGPRRYVLFDELIATIVEIDHDDTPIVEFSMSGADDDAKLPVECGICPDVMHKSKLAVHLKTHLTADGHRYACIYCTETYKDYKYLAGHARRHMGIRPYVCSPCKLYFSTKQDLRVHNQRRHQAKDHICEICGKTFSQNTMLKRHRESTHEKKLRFQCEHCPKAYYKNFALKEHIRNVHLGDRRMLVCPFCGMECRDAHKMARHRRELHLNQSHFQCNICNEEFTEIGYFDAHKRSIQCRNNTKRKQAEGMQIVQIVDEGDSKETFVDLLENE